MGLDLRQPAGGPDVLAARAQVLCFSNLDWGLLRYRKQHLMERLSRHLDVLYINPPRAVKAKRLLASCRTAAVSPSLRVFEPPVLPGIRRSDALKRLNDRLIARLVARRAGRGPAVLWLYSPHALAFLDLLPSDLVIYDVADLYATSSGPAVRGAAEAREITTLGRLEAQLVARADVVLCASEPLVERVSPCARQVHLVPNGCDWERYAKLPGTGSAPEGRPRLGFVGSLAPRVDIGLVAGVARARPAWDIELVGPVSPLLDISSLEGLTNVTLAGEIPYEEVAGRIASFDVCLLPLHEFDFAYCCSPIQVYDYLAAGKAVVSTPVAQLERLPGLVRIASGPKAFVASIESALRERGASHAQARRAFARANSWDVRVEQVLRVIRDTIDAGTIARDRVEQVLAAS